MGPLIQTEGKSCANSISKWRTAENLWQARTSLVPFIVVADKSAYYLMVKKSYELLIRREERFAKTAVGWILREISRHDVSFVRRAIQENINFFSIESLKNATKYFSKKEKNVYLQLFKNA